MFILIIKILSFILGYMFVAYQLMLTLKQHRKGNSQEAVYEMLWALAALLLVNGV